jgi:hypothetical protein
MIYKHVANLLHVSAFSAILREVFNKGKHINNLLNASLRMAEKG